MDAAKIKQNSLRSGKMFIINTQMINEVRLTKFKN